MSKNLLLTLLTGLLLSLLLVGCGEAEEAAAPPPAAEPGVQMAEEAPAAPELAPPQEEPLLIFKRTGGYAQMEDEWRLFGNGRIVDERNNQVQQVDATAVVDLHQDMINNGFMNLAPEYLPGVVESERFTYTVTLIDGDNRHTVITSDSAPNSPDWLRESLGRIATLLVSQRE